MFFFYNYVLRLPRAVFKLLPHRVPLTLYTWIEGAPVSAETRLALHGGLRAICPELY